MKWVIFLCEHYPVAIFSSVLMALMTASCFLLLNHMPGGHRKWPEKIMIFTVAMGAFGTGIAPFFGDPTDLEPSAFDILFRIGTTIFAMWMTLPFWRALPIFDRRKIARATEEPVIPAL